MPHAQAAVDRENRAGDEASLLAREERHRCGHLFGLAEARWRAFATYAYVVAESQIAAPIAQLQREERDRFIEKLMLQPLRP